MAEDNTWEPRENLRNAKDLVREFEEKSREEEIGKAKRANQREDSKEELSKRYIAKMLYGWDNKKFNREY